MKVFLSLLILLASLSAIAQERIDRSCSSSQKNQIELAEGRSLPAMVDLIAHLRERRKAESQLLAYVPVIGRYTVSERLLRAERVLRCALARVPKLTFSCNQEIVDYSGVTLPIVGRNIKFAGQFFGNQPESDLYRVATFIHEATHKCGTTDLDYFSHQEPNDWGMVPWDSIADTYYYWIMNGFCVPGENCGSGRTQHQ